MDIEPVKKQAIKLICSLSDEDLKGKKYSSVTAAAIVHASRLLNLPITMKQILSKIECCDKQMKKVLAIL
jgi:transcription initiation factor TFIIIB Brf1 subunit/transcription initiation factor TFIIB